MHKRKGTLYDPECRYRL